MECRKAAAGVNELAQARVMIAAQAAELDHLRRLASDEELAEGLPWAIEQGMHAGNLSLGTTKKDFFGVLHELTDQAYFRNIPLITAANNMPIASFPSVYASVVSVASHDQRDPKLISYNPAPPVEFGAFGIDVRVGWKGGGCITATGNSFAAPHVTGLVARILGKHPGLNLFELKTVLKVFAGNVTARDIGADP